MVKVSKYRRNQSKFGTALAMVIAMYVNEMWDKWPVDKTSLLHILLQGQIAFLNMMPERWKCAVREAPQKTSIATQRFGKHVT
jgi:hypothetical protein